MEMTRLARRLILSFSLTLVSCLTLNSWVIAQESYRILLSPPEIDDFPRISLYMSIYNMQGEFIHNLKPENITVLEDGVSLGIKELNPIYPGAQVVFAITPGSSFWIRDARGNSRFDYISAALQNWVEGRKTSNTDDLSLLISNGPEATHLEDVDSWLSALQNYPPDNLQASPNLDTLARAFEIAADRSRRPGMGRAVVWITAPPQQDLAPAIQSLIARYNQQGVRLFVWLVASPEQFALPNVSQLANLALESGGTLFTFSGNESLPNLEEMLEPLRNAYFLAYESQIANSGIHQITVQVNNEESQINSTPLEFEIKVLPPNIAFISPPTRIQRLPAEEQSDNPAEWLPLSQTLEVLIEFPDGYERPIRRAVLYVDGEIADENTTSPFDRFTWNLENYTTTGSHTLKAEVTDRLGLTNSSVEHNVLVSIERPSQNLMVMVSRNRTVLAIIAAVLSGIVLLLVLVLGGRIHPGNAPKRKSRPKPRHTDPVTQPVRVRSTPTVPSLSTWLNRFHLTQRPPAPKVYAYLRRVTEKDGDEEATPITITQGEVTFGSDPTQAFYVLNHPSVEALHARMTRLQDGSFKIQDESTTAGTWINYTPVPPEGALLEDGDLIHIGGLGFRFSLPTPTRLRKPVVRFEEPPL